MLRKDEDVSTWEILWLVIAVVFICTTLAHCQTRVAAFPDKEILRRGNFIIAATTDGYLCYGTREPLTASCHKAVRGPWGGR